MSAGRRLCTAISSPPPSPSPPGPAPSPPASARFVRSRRPPPAEPAPPAPLPAAVGAPRSPGLWGSGPGPPWALQGTAATCPGFDVAARGCQDAGAAGRDAPRVRGGADGAGARGACLHPSAGTGRYLPPARPSSAPRPVPRPCGGLMLQRSGASLGPRFRDS